MTDFGQTDFGHIEVAGGGGPGGYGLAVPDGRRYWWGPKFGTFFLFLLTLVLFFFLVRFFVELCWWFGRFLSRNCEEKKCGVHWTSCEAPAAREILDGPEKDGSKEEEGGPEGPEKGSRGRAGGGRGGFREEVKEGRSRDPRPKFANRLGF